MRGTRGSVGSVWLMLLLCASTTRASEDEELAAESRQHYPADLRYYRDQAARPFVATRVGLGVPSSVTIDVGYGKPHFMWAGATSYTFLAPGFVSAGGGLKLDLALINLAVQATRIASFERTLPTRKESYDETDLVTPGRPPAEVTNLAFVLRGYLPAGQTLLSFGARGSLLLDLPEDAGYFHEVFRTFVSGSAALMTDITWFLLLAESRLRVGPHANLVVSDNRSPLLRLGGCVSFSLTTHLALQALAGLPVKKADPALDLMQEFWGLARITWLWASEESHPSLL